MIETKGRGRRIRQNWRIFAENRLALFGVAILFIFSLAPITYSTLRNTIWINQMYDPVTGFDLDSAPHPAPPSWIKAENLAEDNIHRGDYNRPSYDHLLGTDTLGRDVLAVLLASTSHSFLVGLSAAFTTAIIGLLLAAYASYYRGWVDLIIGHISDAFLLLPAPIFMIAIGSFLRSQSTSLTEILYASITGNDLASATVLITRPLEFGLIYGIIAGAGGASLVLRSYGLKVMSFSFIEAARVAGASAHNIIWGHLIPSMSPIAAVYMLVTVTGAIVADGFLAFLGLNPDPLNWGTMVYNAIRYRIINNTIPWTAIVAPALTISLFSAAFYMISRGLQDIVEPRLRKL